MAISLTYNTKSSDSFVNTAGNPWLHIRSKPSIPGAVEDVTTYRIPGREHPLTVRNGNYDPIEITVMFNFKMNPSDWHTKLNAVYAWLQNPDPADPTLLFSNMSVYYNVLHVRVGELAKESPKIWILPVTFICEAIPCEMETVPEPISLGNYFTLTSTGKPYCHPLYVFNVTTAGEVRIYNQTLGKYVYADLAYTGNTYLDTDLMIMYRKTGSTTQNLSSYVRGSYRHIWQVANTTTLAFSKVSTSDAVATLTVYQRKRAFI